MVTITFIAHSTTKDNEAVLSSGWNDVELSELGIKQSKGIGERYKLGDFDAVFVSDLERSYKTATLAFDINPDKLFIDWRLRECDYGELTQHPKAEVDIQKPQRISIPFPGGESYNQTADRMKSFLKDLLLFHDNQKLMIIGHRATQYGLDYWINGTSFETSIATHWKWQPGWEYKLTDIS